MLLCFNEDNFIVSTVSIASVINVVRLSLFSVSENRNNSSRFYKACVAESYCWGCVVLFIVVIVV